jgi:hypothetical protein
VPLVAVPSLLDLQGAGGLLQALACRPVCEAIPEGGVMRIEHLLRQLAELIAVVAIVGGAILIGIYF